MSLVAQQNHAAGTAGVPQTRRGQQLQRRLTRFAQTLQASYQGHRPFEGLGALTAALDYDQAADQIDRAVVEHVPQLMAREDDFCKHQLAHVPVLRELHLHTIFDAKLSPTNRDRIWQHLEGCIMAASPEVKSMLRERDRMQQEKEQKQLAQSNPLGAIVQQMLAQQQANLTPEQRAAAGPQMEAIQNLLQSGILSHAIRLTTAAQQEGVDAPQTVEALEALRVAMREPQVQTSLKTLIAHVAPHLKRVVEGAIQNGANDNPALQQLLGIINAAEDHPFARVYKHMSEPEKLEKMLDLVHKENAPTQDEIAVAVGLDSADQLEELAKSLKVLAENVGDSPGPAGVIAKMLLGVLSRSGVSAAEGTEAADAGEVPSEGELSEELRAARQRQKDEVQQLTGGVPPADIMKSMGPMLASLMGGSGAAPGGAGAPGPDAMASLMPMLAGMMGGGAGGAPGMPPGGAPGADAMASLLPMLSAMGAGGAAPPVPQ